MKGQYTDRATAGMMRGKAFQERLKKNKLQDPYTRKQVQAESVAGTKPGSSQRGNIRRLNAGAYL